MYTQLKLTFIYTQVSFSIPFFYLPIKVTSSFDANNNIVDEVTRLLNKATNQGCSNIILALFIFLAHFRAKLHVGDTHNPGYLLA